MQQITSNTIMETIPPFHLTKVCYTFAGSYVLQYLQLQKNKSTEEKRDRGVKWAAFLQFSPPVKTVIVVGEHSST